MHTAARTAPGIDTIPTLAWCAKPDGSIEFLDKRWLDYTVLSLAEARDFGYQTAFHPDDRDNRREKCRTLFSGNGSAKARSGLDAMTEPTGGFWFWLSSIIACQYITPRPSHHLNTGDLGACATSGVFWPERRR